MKENSYQKRIDLCVEKLRRYFQLNTKLPDEVIDAIISVSKPRKYKKGEYFSKQGDFSGKTAYICDGIMNISSTQEDGALFVVTFMKEDDFVQSRIDFSAPANVTIQALCETVVMEFQTEVLRAMYLQYPQFGNFVRCLVEKLFLSYASHMIQIGTNKAIDNYLLFQKQFQSYEGLIPQYLIAAYLGITPTQLSRIRKKLASA